MNLPQLPFCFLLALACHLAAGPACGQTAAKQSDKKDIYGDAIPPGAVARFGTMRLRHSIGIGARATSTAFFSDGKTLLSAGDSGICAWDAASGKRLSWSVEGENISGFSLHPDGKRVITMSNRGAIEHREAGTGKLLQEFRPPEGASFSSSQPFFSSDGELVGLVDSKTMRLRRTGTGELIFDRKGYESGLFKSSAFSPDGKTLVQSAEGHRAKIIDVASGDVLREIEGPNPAPHLKPGFLKLETESIWWFAFSPDGKTIAGVGKDSVSAWDAETGKRRYVIKETRGPVAFSPDGKQLACTENDAVRLFDAADGKLIRRFEEHNGFAGKPSFSPDGSKLAAAHGYMVRVWDVATGKRLYRLPAHEASVYALAFSPDGAHLASGDSEGGTVIIWDVATQKPRLFLTGHIGMTALAYSPDGKTLAVGDGLGKGATGGMDAHIHLWDTTTGKRVREWSAHLNNVQSLSFSPDGGVLASGGADARARLWEVATGKRLLQIRGGDNWGRLTRFTRDGKALAVDGDADGLILCRVENGERQRVLAEPVEHVKYRNLLPDGRTVVTLESVSVDRRYDHIIRVRDGENGRQRHEVLVPGKSRGFGLEIALSPDGKTLAVSSGGRDSSEIHLWDLVSGQPIGFLAGNKGNQILSMAFSPDGAVLAAGGADTTVLLWPTPRSTLVWKALVYGGDEATRLLWRKDDSPHEAVPLMRKWLQEASTFELRVRDLIADLDDKNFKVRRAALTELEKVAVNAAPLLRERLARPPVSAEVKTRIEELLATVQPGDKGDMMSNPRRAWLSLAVLEELGTAEARQVLSDVARNKSGSALSAAASEAIERLSHKR